MLTIIEIMLTISAWRKGWRAAALLPLGIGLLVAFFFGAMIGGSGMDTDGVWVFGLLVDLAIIVALVIMNARAPQPVNEKTENEAVNKLENTSYASKTM